MRPTEEFVVKKLTTLLRKANEGWYQRDFLYPDYTNQYLAFIMSDNSQRSYDRLFRAQKSLNKLLKNVFTCKELEDLNTFLFIGGLTFNKTDYSYSNTWGDLMGIFKENGVF
ncbi:hypothetical protein BKH42_08790 [Helicobacter sp. 13S00482-2]|uniref:hypothetical protein n=1 Tax=Helicobacter sp. 13S00482-2 TaxID=1476200 RepID=UPI000BA6F96D|nr:hypothetical protein [Helicobacter sp. 13S00482-2]PAF52908.1 hypothetical protein BKH42_08790 [Helicobacter sp. 13S00482-2]